MPFRSEPEEAAVAEVFGTLAVVVAVIFTWSMSIWNSSATTCATLTYSPCPISVPPWFKMHRAVRVDMHQRAGLVADAWR